MTLGHDQAAELLGAYALDACEDDEVEGVEAHLTMCDACAGEVLVLQGTAAWLGASEMKAPPAGLREAIREAARARREDRPAAVAAYLEQVDRLGRLLRDLEPGQWRLVAVPADGWTVQDLVAHLTATEGLVALAVGARRPGEGEELDVFARTAAVLERNRGRDPEETAAEWRDQAEAIRAALGGVTEDGLDRRVPWLGLELPLRRVLLARAFETWIHADDVRRAAGRPPRPPRPGDMRPIADLAVRSLPAALRVLGRDRPRRTARVVLTGPGGGEWTLALGRGEEPGEPDAVLFADVVDFCLLAGGRMASEDLVFRATGDEALAAELVLAAPAFAGP